MESTVPRVRAAIPADRDRVIETVVAAFAGDPAFASFFDTGDYERGCGIYAGYLFDKRVDSGTIWVGADGGAVAMWDRPQAPTAPPVLRAAAWSGMGASATARIDSYDAAVHQALPPEPHWYLGVLACHPDHRGQGLAREVSQTGLEAARREGVPAVLETTAAANVGIYERAGWSVFRELDGVGDLTVWVMCRG